MQKKGDNMRIIFVRHAEPDYSIDSLTEKGFKEAECLSKRVKNWKNITDFYASPLGRAQDTCKTALQYTNRSYQTLEWLKEFNHTIVDKENNIENIIPWDLMPSYWTYLDDIYDKDKWTQTPIYKNANIADHFKEVTKGIDDLLLKYGYKRNGNHYVTDKENDDTTIVLFCHLGVSYVIWGYLTGISPALLWHTFFVAPSSVTVLGCEEREKGIAQFRLQTVGDTKHLALENEPISHMGAFFEIFQD